MIFCQPPASNCDKDFESLYTKYANMYKYNYNMQLRAAVGDSFSNTVDDLKNAILAFKATNNACPIYGYVSKTLESTLQLATIFRTTAETKAPELREDYELIKFFMSKLEANYSQYRLDSNIKAVRDELNKEVDRIGALLTTTSAALQKLINSSSIVVKQKADSVYNQLLRTDTIASNLFLKVDSTKKILSAFTPWYLGGGIHSKSTYSLSGSVSFNIRPIRSALSLDLFTQSLREAKSTYGLTANAGFYFRNIAFMPLGLAYSQDKAYYNPKISFITNGIMLSINYNSLTGGGLSFLIGVRPKQFQPE